MSLLQRKSPSAISAPLREPLLSLLFILIAACPALAEGGESSLIRNVRVGFDGAYKVGYWTPVEVELGNLSALISTSAGEVTLEVVVPDGDGVPSQVSKRVAFGGEVQQVARLFVKFGRVKSWLEVRVRSGDRIVAERRFEADKTSEDFKPALPASDMLVVVVGNDLFEKGLRRRNDALERFHVVQLPDARSLPNKWFGYDGVDSLLITSAWHTDADEASRFSDTQKEALNRWVRLGGQLVVSAGANAKQTLAADSPLSLFAPGKLQQVVELPQAAAFESFVGGAHRLDSGDGRGARLTFPIARLSDVGGDIELAADDVPLVVRSRRSFGEIVFVAVDLSEPPFTSWNGQASFVARLLGQESNAATRSSDTSAARIAGYDDLCGQLRGTLDQFEGVVVFSRYAGLVFGLIVVFGLIIGPFDYLVVRRLFRRGQMTWLTFPLLLIIASGAAYALASRLKGMQPKLNQVDLVDIDSATGLIRGVNWTHAYSPEAGDLRYNFRFRPREDGDLVHDSEILASWMGLPGRSIGGMDTTLVDMNSYRRPYQLDGADLLEVPIPASSSKSLTARWHGRSKPVVEANLVAKDGVVFDDESSLHWTADVELHEAYLFHHRWVYQIGDLKSGDKIELKAAGRRNVDWLLNRRRFVDGKTVATPYEDRNLDVPYVIDSMMFHSAAGGASYTKGLENRYMASPI